MTFLMYLPGWDLTLEAKFRWRAGLEIGAVGCLPVEVHDA